MSGWRSWINRLQTWRQDRRAIEAGRGAYANALTYHAIFSLPGPGWKPKTRKEALEYLRALQAVRADCDKAAVLAMEREIAKGKRVNEKR